MKNLTLISPTPSIVGKLPHFKHLGDFGAGVGSPLELTLNLFGNLQGVAGTRSAWESSTGGGTAVLGPVVIIHHFLVDHMHLILQPPTFRGLRLAGLLVVVGVLVIIGGGGGVDELLIAVDFLDDLALVILILQVGDPFLLSDLPGIAAGRVLSLRIVLIIVVEEVEEIPGGSPRRGRRRRRRFGGGGGGRRRAVGRRRSVIWRSPIVGRRGRS